MDESDEVSRTRNIPIFGPYLENGITLFQVYLCSNCNQHHEAKKDWNIYSRLEAVHNVTPTSLLLSTPTTVIIPEDRSKPTFYQSTTKLISIFPGQHHGTINSGIQSCQYSRCCVLRPVHWRQYGNFQHGHPDFAATTTIQESWKLKRKALLDFSSASHARSTSCLAMAEYVQHGKQGGTCGCCWQFCFLYVCRSVLGSRCCFAVSFAGHRCRIVCNNRTIYLAVHEELER